MGLAIFDVGSARPVFSSPDCGFYGGHSCVREFTPVPVSSFAQKAPEGAGGERRTLTGRKNVPKQDSVTDLTLLVTFCSPPDGDGLRLQPLLL